MKPEQSNENRLDGTVMQQVSEHQNNMNMGMMDNMGLSMPMMMSSNSQQQITSVPMDNSGSSVQNVQPVAGPSTQTTHDQITQNQTEAPTQQEEEEESSEEDENSDDECDGDEGTYLCYALHLVTVMHLINRQIAKKFEKCRKKKKKKIFKILFKAYL